MKFEDLVEQIRRDNVSGAVQITRKAAKALILWSQKGKRVSSNQLIEELLALGISLIEAQPSMAPIFNLVNRVLLRVENLKEGEQVRREAAKLAREYLKEMERNTARIAGKASSVIDDASLIMTYSYSSSVLGSLIAARKKGKEFEVICAESRPLCEGRNMVRRLGQEGIKSRLVIDAGLSSFLKDTDLILIGADSLTIAGIVNKIGSHGLAILARANKVPFFAICGSDKFLPRQLAECPEIELKDPREILERPLKNVTVINYYFDITPLSLISGVICEEGVLSRKKILSRLRKIKVSPRLLSKLKFTPGN